MNKLSIKKENINSQHVAIDSKAAISMLQKCFTYFHKYFEYQATQMHNRF
jgi:hypothetical protein